MELCVERLAERVDLSTVGLIGGAAQQHGTVYWTGRRSSICCPVVVVGGCSTAVAVSRLSVIHWEASVVLYVT